MSKDPFIDSADWRVERWPSTPTHGMLTGNMSTGVRVTHIPTGIVEIEEQSRHMHINKMNAVNRVLKLLSAGKGGE
jgi:protein subunit release factor A